MWGGLSRGGDRSLFLYTRNAQSISSPARTGMCVFTHTHLRSGSVRSDCAGARQTSQPPGTCIGSLVRRHTRAPYSNLRKGAILTPSNGKRLRGILNFAMRPMHLTESKTPALQLVAGDRLFYSGYDYNCST